MVWVLGDGALVRKRKGSPLTLSLGLRVQARISP